MASEQRKVLGPQFLVEHGGSVMIGPGKDGRGGGGYGDSSIK